MRERESRASEQCAVILSQAMDSDWYTVSITFFFGVIAAFVAVAAVSTRRRDSGSSSTSLSSSGINYEVFINFRGTDTRKEFTDLLHNQLKSAGIQVFIDEKSLCAGEEIKRGLKEAIKRSRISIAIFSKDYASSESCLTELVHMWECRQLDGQTIIPIFYDVSPNDVKHQAGDFATSFEKHEQSGKFDATTIGRWKEVLQLVAGLKGYEREKINDGHVSALLGEVFTRVTEVLNKNDRPITNKLVGIDVHVQEMMRKLGVVYNDGQAIEVCGGDVRVVSICSMPGIGKTTLAKVVFNRAYQLFDGCSFLDEKNLVEVKVSQELLIADLKKEKRTLLKSSDDGIKIISSLFSNMKVLIVLDGVFEVEQIEKSVGKLTWFGPGSRIIVTTDRQGVLDGFDDVSAVKEHKVGPLSYPDAYRLFCKYAFGGDDALPSDPEYNSLPLEIVDAFGGHPLAIVLWAGYLRRNRKDMKIWSETLDLLKKNRQDRVEQKVEAAFKASYDYINDRTKKIFLDTVSFFIGEDQRTASFMWEDCDYYPARELKLLREMYLLEIGENNELRMHDLVRKFGRKLVESEALNERSRIWNLSDALSILRDGKGTEKVEGIGLTVAEGCTVSFTCEELHKMSNLRYLGLDRANIQGTAQNLLPNLRWLKWPACCLISELGNMHLENLVILDLSYSLVTGDSQVWGQIMEKMKKLKVLKLQGCTLLPALLDFPAPINLEILILEDCTQIAQIGPFIRQLEKLSSLNLKNCSRVKQLSQELGCMKSLKELLIDGTGVEIIYIQEDSLQKLEKLSACGCKKLKDISTIGHLGKLTSLALDGSANIDWDTAFEFPRKLQRLSLRNCSTFNELPQSIGELTQLEEIDLSNNGIKEMPPSFENLSNLKILKMARTHLQYFPKEIAKFRKLEEIDFSGCRSLGGQVPCDISGLCSLRILRLSSTKVAGLPRSICHLSCLQTVDLLKCNQLNALPELPSGLVRLSWGSKNMTVPILSYLTSLKELCLEDVEHEQPSEGLLKLETRTTLDFGWIPRLTSLETLKLSLSKVNNLPGNFSALTHLQKLSLSYMEKLDLTQLPSSSLSTLRLKDSKIQEPKFSSMIFLSELELNNCDLAEINGLGDLKRLGVLKISLCRRITNLDGLQKIGRLQKVQVFSSPEVILPQLSECVVVDRCD